jgi:flagellar operon protein (TIGR03826 family)
MDVRNCIKCGKLFNYVTGQPICQNCRKDLEDKFKEVKNYIKKNPQAYLAEVSQECDVDTRQIKQWIREERLSFSEASLVGIECEICGKSIRTGRYCDECKKTVTNTLNSAYQQNSKPIENNPFKTQDTGSKMRFLNKDNI